MACATFVSCYQPMRYNLFGDKEGVMDSEFHTLKGYQLLKTGAITESMEDYLEMLCRHMRDHDYMRIHLLAQRLNVRPSSASKMVSKLRGMGLVRVEKYGLILLTDEGRALGDYFLWRHGVLQRFFCRLNHTDDALELVEQVEHFLDKETLKNLEKLTIQMEKAEE